MLKTAAEMQSGRSRRAIENLSRYTFRRNHSGGIVIKKREDGTEYTVTAAGCNCRDFTDRCSKVEGLRCKHVEMVTLTGLRF